MITKNKDITQLQLSIRTLRSPRHVANSSTAVVADRELEVVDICRTHDYTGVEAPSGPTIYILDHRKYNYYV